jgi:hypothetical protein
VGRHRRLDKRTERGIFTRWIGPVLAADGAVKSPSRRIVVAVVILLSALLLHPVSARYLYPEQDVPIAAAMGELARGGIEPFIVVYPSALTNLLRLGDELLFAVGKAAGWWRDRAELYAAWARAPWRLRYRLPPRLVAVVAGMATLAVVAGAAALVCPGWAALAAPIVLGTSLMFVREFHHGMYDAPAAAAAMLACAGAMRFVRGARTIDLVLAAVATALAIGFKYNLAVAVVAPAVAVLAAPAGTPRVRAGVVATLAALLALVVVMPVVVLDPLRLWRDLSALAPRQIEILRQHAPHDGHGVIASLRLGFGTLATGIGVAGLVLACVRPERRALVPLVAFTLAYGAVLARTPLVLNRYAVPLAPPLAVLAAYAIGAVPRPLGAIATLAIAGLALPSSIQHDRLLATEDTRVTAARWIERHRADGAPIYLGGTPGSIGYGGPDVAPPIHVPGVPDVDVRYFEPKPGDPGDARRLLPYAGGVVVTSEHPSPLLERAGTKPADVALLERHGRVVLYLPIEHAPDPSRVYEPFDLHYLPFTGLATLARPGPHVRIWEVPRADALAGG